jgi:hypothetical protein
MLHSPWEELMRIKIAAARRATTIALAWLLLAGTAWAQGLEYIKANYTKHEHRVAMRDGVKLFTAVYVPKDASRRYPILLTRTPYGAGPYGEDRYPNALVLEQFAREGYIFATQDVRGRNKSEGEFVNIRPIKPVKNGPADTDASTDTWDTVDWLVKNVPQNNGRVGMWGISYPGFYAAAGMIDAHPALKAVSPQAPIADWFVGDDFHHNGALYLAHAFGFLSLFGRPQDTPRFDPGTPDGYRFYLDSDRRAAGATTVLLCETLCPLCLGGEKTGHFTAIVTVLLGTPFWVSTSGTALPAATPAGTRAFTWCSPTNPGASPANSTVASTPPIVTFTGVVTSASGGTAGAACPVATAGLVAPKPVA